MAGKNLPVNVDTSYADDTQDPSVKIHQGHHDDIHEMVNLLDTDLVNADDGDTLVWRDADGAFVPEPATGTAGPDGPPGADGADGVGFLFLGTWDAGTTYHVYTDNTPDTYEVVEFLGSTYVALATHTNSPPPLPEDAPSANWALYVAKGDEGPPGVDGVDGTSVTGPAGPPGPSRENLSPSASLDGTEIMDLGAFTGYLRQLDGNSIVEFVDTSGASFSAATLRLTMGSGGPYTITWPDLDSGQWISTNDVTPGEPPDLSGMSAGDEITVVVEQMAGAWRGYVPGGSGGGGVVTPPPDVFPTLLMGNLLSTAVRGTQTIPANGNPVLFANMGTPVQVRGNSGAFAFIGITGVGGIDPPPLTSLTGGGATWTQLATSTDEDTTSALRRRMTLFYAREVAPGAAATFTVTQPGAVGQQFTSCSLHVVQTTVDVPGSSFLALLQSSVKVRSNNSGAGGDELPQTARVHMDAASDAANRNLWGFMTNFTPSNNPVLDPDAGYTELTPVASINNPNNQMWVLWKAGAPFDTEPASQYHDAVQAAGVLGAPWIAIGVELEQG